MANKFEWEVRHTPKGAPEYVDVKAALDPDDMAHHILGKVEIILYVRDYDENNDDYTHVDMEHLSDTQTMPKAFIDKYSIPANALAGIEIK